MNNVNVETVFVLLIRCYDLNLKDEATYWFYYAQNMAYIFYDTVDPDQLNITFSPEFNLLQALQSFHELGGEYINGYAFGDIDKVKEILNKVIIDSKTPIDKIAV